MFIDIGSRGISALALFVVAGIVLFFDGFRKWRRKRLIENIPTSKIRSMAMGLVELFGQAEPYLAMLNAPLSGEACVFYKYLIERYEHRGKHSRWVILADSASYHNPFYLNDGTGKVLVDLQGVELHMDECDFAFETGVFGQEYPQSLLNFLVQNNIKYKSFFGKYRMRFKEWRIHPNDKIYALGSVQKKENFISDFKSRLYEKIEKIKNDPIEMKKIDKNQDGTMSMDEWGQAVQNIEMDLLEEGQENINKPLETDLVIAKGQEEKIFIISEKSEKDLTMSLSWMAALEISGGAALAIICLTLLYFLVTKNYN